MTDTLALWSAQEVRTQAEQAHGQMDVWDVLADLAAEIAAQECAGCGAEPAEPCRWGCTAQPEAQS